MVLIKEAVLMVGTCTAARLIITDKKFYYTLNSLSLF